MSPFLSCVNFCRKKAAPRNFHLAGRRRLPFIGAILAQIDLTHNTLWTLSPISRKILHERPGTSGQLLCAPPWRNIPRAMGPATAASIFCPAGQSLLRFAQRFSTKNPQGWSHRAESSILHVPSAVFQELHNFIFLSLCTLRIDKSIRNMYNKARNQRSTAEAQERANPAGLKQKGARPMVDMEPAQQGQAVGIR